MRHKGAVQKRLQKKIAMDDKSWGNFDLLFGAAKLSLRIHEMPVHYKMRTAGKSKMKVFKHVVTVMAFCFSKTPYARYATRPTCYIFHIFDKRYIMGLSGSG